MTQEIRYPTIEYREDALSDSDSRKLMRGSRGVKVSLRSELRKEFIRYEFREYKCSGRNCDFTAVGIAGLRFYCATEGCRGNTTAGKKVSPKKMLEMEIKARSKADSAQNLALDNAFHGVSLS